MTLAALLLASLPVTVLLQDGTRLQGTPRTTQFTALVAAQTTTNLPWKSIRSISVQEPPTVLVELHGARRLRVRPVAPHLAIATKQLGVVNVPWTSMDECRPESAGDDITWLSAPTDTGFTVGPTGIITLQGGRALTAQRYRLPLTVECEILLASRSGQAETWLEWTLVTDKPRRGQPADPASARIAAAMRTKDGWQAGLILRLMHTAQNTARRPGEPPFTLAAGVWHRARVQFGHDRLLVEWNGRPYELQGVSLPNQPVQLALASRDVSQRWHVRHVVIRDQQTASAMP